MVFNDTFKHISVVSWWSLLEVEETGVEFTIICIYKNVYFFKYCKLVSTNLNESAVVKKMTYSSSKKQGSTIHVIRV